MWLILEMRSTLKMKLSYHEQLNQVHSVMKSRQDNSMIDRIGLVYVVTKIELSITVWLGVVCDKN